MTIKKYAHACLLIEKEGVRILIDPGSWNELPRATNVVVLLITHEHQDHCDLGQVRALVAANPGMRIITHTAVADLLSKEGIVAEVIEPEGVVDVSGVEIQSFGTEHAAIYNTSPCRNTGFLLGGEVFVPGDALHDIPNVPVRVLALPTGGPWMKIAEAIDYAKQVQPTIVFPIHDAMYIESYQRGLIPRIVGGTLGEAGIEFIDMPAGATHDF
jgi:L-ascorbate metabolism protein UlaG (beta-lactamase superfamily)